MSTEDNKALVLRVLEEIINKGNLALADEIIASDYTYRSPGSPELRGPEGFKQLVQMYITAFPDLHMTVEEQIAEGDSVVTRWVGTGTQHGELMGVPPTGKQATVDGIVISRIVNGKVVGETEIFDAMGLMQQLGAMPVPAGAAA